MAIGGNARTKFADLTEPPWYRWREKDPAERCIRFIETYCRSAKGRGHGKPIRLAPFQKRWIRTILQPGIREAVLQAPRGAGKSTLLAAIAVWALFDKNPTGYPDVRICATTIQQAIDTVYGVACKMVAAEPELNNRAIIRTSPSSARIDVGYSGGVCMPITNTEDRLEGLDYSLFVLDEVAKHPYEVWSVASMATGKRDQSLMIGIGTPAPDKEKSALWELHQIWEDGRSPEGFSFTKLSAPDDCDYRDEAMWRIANPAIDEGYLSIDALRNDVVTKSESFFRVYRLAQWAEGMDCWLGVDGRRVWRNLKSNYQLVPGAETFVGVDIGTKHDCSAVVLGQRTPNGVLHTTAMIWTPTDKQAVDVSAVMKYLRDMSKLYKFNQVAYDPAYFEIQATDLTDEGLPMVEISQTPQRMVPACEALYEAVMLRKLSHDGAIDFERHILNAMPTYTDNGFRLTKRKSRGHIDAAIALALCHDRASKPAKPLPKFIAL